MSVAEEQTTPSLTSRRIWQENVDKVQIKECPFCHPTSGKVKSVPVYYIPPVTLSMQVCALTYVHPNVESTCCVAGQYVEAVHLDREWQLLLSSVKATCGAVVVTCQVLILCLV